MAIKIILVTILLGGLVLVYNSFVRVEKPQETTIDKTWWDGLSKEWKAILLINQNFQKQHLDIYTLQEQYINRMNKKGEEDLSEINTSLHELNELKKFGLSYTDLYARALRTNFVVGNDSIDLANLGKLDKIYMVNGPADLRPLLKFPHLKVLIINYCGADNSTPISKQVLDITPLKYLRELEILQCASSALTSLEPIKDLVKMEELNCTNTAVTSLAPLKKLINLRRLSVGSAVKNADAISNLENLEELHINGCREVPDLTRLKRIRKLSVSENEMAIVSAGYRITDFNFLNTLHSLKFLDLGNTSYKGNLKELDNLQFLEAITLPSIKNADMLQFKRVHKNCIIINSFQFEI
ncbi:MAG: hypothetical protein ABIQ31_03685 [Ferruginibacter sp.]